MEYKSCWIAYFDLLGFENRVKLFHVGAILDDYKVALDEIKGYANGLEARWFSDTFLFYTGDDSIDSFRSMNVACQSFLRRMMGRRIPLRGCLTVGDLYIDNQDGVLVGPALIEAYRTAEGQDWLGFVLTDKATEKIKQYDVNGRSLHDGLIEHSYRYYDVPFKRNHSIPRLLRRLSVALLGREFKSLVRRKSLVGTMSLLPSHGREQPELVANLYRELENMEYEASVVLRQLQKAHLTWSQRLRLRIRRRDIIRKYTETKNFLLDTVPELRESAHGQTVKSP